MNNISNKNLVLDLYKKVIRDRNGDLIDTYISDDYIQHSPSMKDGKAGLRDAIEYLKRLPKPKEDKSPIILAIDDGDFVMLLLDLSFMGKHLSVADLFKVIDGKIVEHWDAIQDLTGIPITIGTITAPEFTVTEERDLQVSESNKTLVRLLFENSDLNRNDLDKEFSDALRQRQPVKLHRILACGNVVGVQSEGVRSGKQFVFYDFVSIIDSRITRHWSVEQEIPLALAHNNRMI
ncbi:MAG TPA: nuclear transport factor 2 family protein [Chryseolinea sp.]|nr:nuclear transport factor 2 family protein [Chryseolinea sp.]